jgi:hypothetical protein
MSETKYPRWLEKDGERRLFAADDVEAACINGWSEPEGVRGNGEPYNPEPVEGETPQVVHVAELAKANAEVKAKRDEAKAKADEKARKDAEKARESAPEQADMKVQIVEPKKK